jgi:ABC-type polysaccharide/polyol phosphate transport system ATPase subunit
VDAIVASGISKTYRIGVGRARVREMLPWPLDAGVSRLFPRWWARNTFNALEDVSISVPAGDGVGIVGHNGAGKTTLLRVIAGVTAPTRGRVETSGRVGALIDVLVGFHPELTGVENAYLLGAMLGQKRRDMAKRVDGIFEFAEIDELAGTPVKRYSAGMLARLGFATLVGVEPEILLVDEVLAVGDASFQRKCVEWLEGYHTRGGTLLFVSHNLGLIRSMTQRVLWIDHGKIAAEGPTGQILPEYARSLERRADPAAGRGMGKKGLVERGMYRWGAGGARVDTVHFEEPDPDEQTLDITITYRASGMERGFFCVGFVDEAGREIGAASSPSIELAEAGTVRCQIQQSSFRSGIYFPVAAILSSDGQVQDRWRLDRAVIVSRNGDTVGAEVFGPVDIPADWSGG